MDIHQVRKKIHKLTKDTDRKIANQTTVIVKEVGRQVNKAKIRGYK